MAKFLFQCLDFKTLKKMLLWQNVCQSRLEILPNTNKPSKDCLTVLEMGQSGEISPNLVTLS